MWEKYLEMNWVTWLFFLISIKDTNKNCTEDGAETDTLSPVLFEDSPSASPTVPCPDGKVEVFGTSPEEAVREMRFRIEQKTTLTASAGQDLIPFYLLIMVSNSIIKTFKMAVFSYLVCLCYRYCPKHDACESVQWQEQTQWTVQNPPRETGCDGFHPESACSEGLWPSKSNRHTRWTVPRLILSTFILQVPGIGKVTEKMLSALDIITCAQFGQQMTILSLLFSETSWHHFLQISLGLGSSRIERCEALASFVCSTLVSK